MRTNSERFSENIFAQKLLYERKFSVKTILEKILCQHFNEIFQRVINRRGGRGGTNSHITTLHKQATLHFIRIKEIVLNKAKKK